MFETTAGLCAKCQAIHDPSEPCSRVDLAIANRQRRLGLAPGAASYSSLRLSLPKGEPMGEQRKVITAVTENSETLLTTA
jgi:hypothetical protein